GFAVAAHLRSDIGLMDEILSLGDFAFQHKCLGKIGEIANDGRTVLCVSHNAGAIEAICDTAVWIDKGVIAGAGPVATTVSRYLRSMIEEQTASLDERHDRIGDGAVRLCSISTETLD